LLRRFSEVISMATNKRVGSPAKQAGGGSRAKRPDPPNPSRSDKGTFGRLAAAKVGAALDQVDELLCQALETELGGVQVYRTALRCAQDAGLRAEWEGYLEQTERHVRLLNDVFEARELDPETETLGRQIVRHKGQALVAAMETAHRYGTPEAAQLVAAECVVDAETKDHANWELLGRVVEKLQGKAASVLKVAYDEVEDEEDEHLYHGMGWARELWIQSLGLPAVLPPPEERRHVKDAVSAAAAKESRRELVGARG
jgi:rubrerythrin